jgi:hypothetical protein
LFLQVYAFVAPKIIGGVKAPSPVGELGMVQMSQAVNLVDISYEKVIFFSKKILVYEFWAYASMLYEIDATDYHY